MWRQPSSNRPILRSFRGMSEFAGSSYCDLVRPAMAPIKWSITPIAKKVNSYKSNRGKINFAKVKNKYTCNI